MSSAGRIDLDLGLNYNQFQRQLGGIAGTANNLVGGAFKKLAGLVAAAFAVKGIVGFAQEAIKLASDLAEVQNVVDVTFGEMAWHVDEFANNALESFGLSELAAKKFASTMGAMLKSSGLTGNAVVKLSEDITGLSADFASFYNLGNQEAFDKIRSGISGETEPLKALGINMSVANLEAYALTQGIKKQFAAMTQAEQVMLRYNYLLSVSADAQGDFARNGDSWANQTKVLNERWKIFQGTIGEGLITALTPVLAMLNKFMAKMQIAAQYFNAFVNLITGAKPKAASAASAISGMGDASSTLSSDVKKAGKAVKGSLSSFDDLNIISQSTAEAMGDIAGGAGDMGEIDLGGGGKKEIEPMDMSAFQPMLDFLEKVKAVSLEAFTAVSGIFGPPLVAAWETIKPTLEELKNTFTVIFKDIVALGTPFVSWLKTDFAENIKNYIGVVSNVISGLLDTANMVFQGIWEAAKPVLEWFVNDGLPLVSSFYDGFLEIFNDMFNAVKHIFDTLWEGGMKPGLDLISTVIVDTLNIIKGFWDTFGEDIVEGIRTAIAGVVEIFDTWWEAYLKPVWENLLRNWKNLWDNHIKGLVEQISIFIGKLVAGALEIFNKFIVPVTKYLVEKLGPVFAKVFNTISNVVFTVVGVIADVAKGIFKALGGIIDFLVGAFTGDWERAWGGIKEFFSGIMDGIVAIFKGAINLVISGLNGLIRALNTIKFELPDWVPGIGGKGFGINIPEIPKLAKGGLAEAPTLAMVGDNKNASVDPEVITPLSKLQDMLGSSNQAMVEVLFMILDALEGLNLSLDIDGEKLTRVVRKHLKIEDGRVGQGSITVGGVAIS